jgi:ApaG protein
MNMSNESINIEVRPAYIEQQSNPEEKRYVFSYTVTITNLGDRAVTLRKRHWVITDSYFREQEIRGEGVVGKQPRLIPGAQFQYTSGAVLKTSVNTMHGDYEMATDQGETFLAPIERFTLSIPRTLH